MCYILEAIFEPSFSPQSFGFRGGLGCHDALYHIHKKYQAIRWFIEGDISKCFDEIDHNLLMETIQKRIADQKFLRLIRKALKAGYLNMDKVPQNCLVGTPQGSIISPILCSIFLDNFDKFVADQLIPRYNKGEKRRQPKLYQYHMATARYNSNRYKKSGNQDLLKKAQHHRNEGQKLPSTDPSDPNFRRLYYIRYADDWLIGFAGTHAEATEI